MLTWLMFALLIPDPPKGWNKTECQQLEIRSNSPFKKRENMNLFSREYIIKTLAHISLESTLFSCTLSSQKELHL